MGRRDATAQHWAGVLGDGLCSLMPRGSGGCIC